MVIRIVAFFILYFFSGQLAFSESYGILISGGIDLYNNHDRYYKNLKKMHQALGVLGYKRNNIYTFYADGGQVGPDASVDSIFPVKLMTNKVDTDNSFRGDKISDIRGPAKKESIEKDGFDQIAKVAKPGDNIFMFITDHGSKQEGVVLWEDERLTVADLERYLKKIPPGVTVQIVVNMCFGGQIMRLTRDNICVVSNSTEDTLTYSRAGHSPFVDGLTASVKNVSAIGGRVSLSDVFQAAVRADEKMGNHPMTSLDYMIQHQPQYISNSHLSGRACDEFKGTFHNLIAEVKEISDFVESSDFQQNGSHEKELLQRLAKVKKNLASTKALYLKWSFEKFNREMESFVKAWENFSDAFKEKFRGEFTSKVQALKAEKQERLRQIESFENEQMRLLAELRFLKTARPSQKSSYEKIKSCLEKPL